jgi:type VI secretion system protein ImpL
MTLAHWWPWILVGAVCVVLILVIVVVLVLRRARVSATPAMVAQRNASSGAGSAGTSVFALRRSFAAGMAVLRRFTPRAADRLAAPWVLSIGGPDAGKSALLDGLSLPRVGGWMDAGSPVGEAPCRWHFFERGVVLDLSAALLGTPGSGAGRQLGWRTLIGLLQRYRPERPADAVVVFIPSTELTGPQRMSGEALDGESDRLNTCLAELSRGLGLQLPVYVVVTKCDRIPGFAAFCHALPSDRRQQILGWSAPYSMDAAFSPSWVDEAMTALLRGVQDSELALFCEDASVDRDELVLLPTRIGALAPPLRSFLTRLFRSTAYDAACPFRGVYLAGDMDRSPPVEVTANGIPFAASTTAAVAASWTAAEAAVAPAGLPPDEMHVPAVRPLVRCAFVADLFNEKVFAEHGLARPSRRVLLSKNRAVAAMQVATAAVLVFGPLALLAAANGIHLGSFTVSQGVRSEVATVAPLLDSIEARERVVATGGTIDGAGVFTLLNTMAGVSTDRVGSILLPSSVFGPLHRDIERSIQRTFEFVVFRELHQRLTKRMHQVLGESPDNGSPGLPFGPSLPQYLVDVRVLGENIDRFNQLVTAGAGTTRELADLVQYLFGNRQIMPGFLENDAYYRNALARSTFDPLEVSATDSAAALKRAVSLTAQSYDAVVARLTGSSPADESAPDNGMESLRSDVTAVIGLRAFLDTAGPVQQALAAIPPTFAFGSTFAPTVRETLALYRDRLTGQLSSLRTSSAYSSSTTLRTLDMLLRQRFMQGAVGQVVPASIPRGMELRWNVAGLDEAVALDSGCQRFLTYGLDSLPDGVRGNVRRVATAQLAAVMAQMVADAAILTPRSASTGSESIRDTRAAVTAFDQSAARVARLIDMFDTIGATAMEDSLQDLSTQQASQLLARVDAFADLSGRYVLPASALAAWNGQAPFSAALGSRETGLADFLRNEEETIRAAAEIARPVVSFLDTLDAASQTASRSLRVWGDVFSALDRADRKPPSGPLGTLDKTFIPDVDSIDVHTCLHRPVRPATGDDLLSRRLDELRRAVWQRCVDVATSGARARYARVQDLFQKRLAGRFPFSSSAVAPDVAPEDIVAVLKEYDALGPDAALAGAANPQVARFLADMEAVRRFFAPLVDSVARPPTIDYQIDFRVNRAQEIDANQIAEWSADIGAQHAAIDASDAMRRGRWHAGDSVRVTLRWASGSLWVPVEVASPGAAVHDGTLEIAFGGPWSLLRLLSTYANGDSSAGGGTTMGIVARTAPRQNPSAPTASIRAYVRVRLFDPDTKLELSLPHFPVVAPTASSENGR